MIELEGRPYRVLLLDTNFVSRLLDQPDSRWGRLLSRVDVSTTIFAISIFTLLEVRDRPVAYRKFLGLLALFPLVILKSVHQLIEAEIASYPEPSRVDPILLAPVGIRPEAGQTKEAAIRWVFEHPESVSLMDELRSDRSEILESILGLRPNFPRPRGGYTADHARDFVAKVCFQQVAATDLAWIERMGGATFDFDAHAFPSLKSSAYSVFYRFYSDPARRPRRSDAFDVATASVLPYVDAAAIERNQAHILRKQVARVDPFLSHLELLTFQDLAVV